MFGTSNKKYHSKKLMIERLTSCFSEESINRLGSFSLLFKSIVQPKYAVKFPNPHYVEYVNGYFAVNTNKQSLKEYPLVILPAIYDKLKINHYWTRDEDYFLNIKIPRQIQLHGPDHKTSEMLYQFNESKNYDIQRFVPELKKRMKLN